MAKSNEIKTGGISQRVLMSNAVQFKDGKLFIWGIPGAIFSNYAFSYLFGVFNHIKCKKGIDAVYWMGFHQAYGASIVIHEKFGIKQKVLENVVGQGEMLGQGKIVIKRADFKNAHFIFESESSIAEEYLSVFGPSEESICHHLRGLFAGLSSYIAQQDLVCTEKECIAKGDPRCIFIVKPKDEFDLNDPVIKSHIPEPFPKPDELGDKRTVKILK